MKVKYDKYDIELHKVDNWSAYKYGREKWSADFLDSYSTGSF